LGDIPHDDLMRQVDAFADDNGLQDIAPLLKKGALVAQNPTEFESVKGLTEEEKEHLRFEVTHKWKHPRALYLTIIVCSIGAAVQGWDQASFISSPSCNIDTELVANPRCSRLARTAPILVSPKNLALATAMTPHCQTTTETIGLLGWSTLRLTSALLSCVSYACRHSLVSY
jgi:hypothetical protein